MQRKDSPLGGIDRVSRVLNLAACGNPILTWMIQLMNGAWDIFTPGGHFLGIQWHPWKLIGWLGNGVFFSRFLVQWYATEKRKQVVIPVAFWWLSIAGALLLFAYATLYQRDSVFIFAYAFTWIPYIRNLLIHYRHKESSRRCPSCSRTCPPEANFCATCGVSLK